MTFLSRCGAGSRELLPLLLVQRAWQKQQPPRQQLHSRLRARRRLAAHHRRKRRTRLPNKCCTAPARAAALLSRSANQQLQRHCLPPRPPSCRPTTKELPISADALAVGTRQPVRLSGEAGRWGRTKAAMEAAASPEPPDALAPKKVFRTKKTQKINPTKTPAPHPPALRRRASPRAPPRARRPAASASPPPSPASPPPPSPPALRAGTIPGRRAPGPSSRRRRGSGLGARP